MPDRNHSMANPIWFLAHAAPSASVTTPSFQPEPDSICPPGEAQEASASIQPPHAQLIAAHQEATDAPSQPVDKGQQAQGMNAARVMQKAKKTQVSAGPPRSTNLHAEPRAADLVCAGGSETPRRWPCWSRGSPR